jgi:hypothetical protein
LQFEGLTHQTNQNKEQEYNSIGMFLRFILVVCIVVSAFAWDNFPERARGGELYKQYVSQQGKSLTSSSALTWNAPVDHFSNSTNTFAQR